MFGSNEIVGQKFFPDDDKLLVTSIFVTMQGEGPYSGMPAVFVRLAKCNLACTFCDTYFDSGDLLTFHELNERLNQVILGSRLPKQKRHYVLIITGGEPMLQKALPEWLLTQTGLWKAIQIETNGTVMRSIPLDVKLVVSPKCAEKYGKPTKYLKPNQSALSWAKCLKFVMSADKASPYSEVPDWAHDWAHLTGREIYVSPMNIYAREPKRAKIARNANSTTIEDRSAIDEVVSFWEEGLLDREANQKNHEYAARYAIEHGLRFQLQVHLYAGLA